MPDQKLLSRLAGGDRRSLGRANEIARIVAKNPRRFPELFAGLWAEDPLVRMRAADAAEKVTKENPELLQKYKNELLGLLADCDQIEVRWHLALMVPRLRLSAEERRRVASLLQACLDDRSSIVKTHALQGLADLAENDAEFRPSVIEILREAARAGTAAMRARSRILLARLERDLPTHARRSHLRRPSIFHS